MHRALVAIEKEKPKKCGSRIKQLISRKNRNQEKINSSSVPFDKRMRHLENYFKQHSVNDSSFIPEYEASRKINQIALKENLTSEELEQIVKIFNQTNKLDHYNGSGWYDLKTAYNFINNEIQF